MKEIRPMNDVPKRKDTAREAGHPSPLSWLLVALSWLLVSLPLAWGIWKTLEKAAVLFRGS